MTSLVWPHTSTLSRFHLCACAYELFETLAFLLQLVTCKLSSLATWARLKSGFSCAYGPAGTNNRLHTLTLSCPLYTHFHIITVQLQLISLDRSSSSIVTLTRSFKILQEFSMGWKVRSLDQRYSNFSPHEPPFFFFLRTLLKFVI